MFSLWDMVKPDGPEPMYFFAEHARGLQKEWVEYFNEMLFKDRISVPSCENPKIRCYIDTQDKDTPTCAYPHTRFHCGSNAPNEDLQVIVTKLRQHVLCDTLQVAIFEDKFDEELIMSIEPAKFHEFLDKRILQRLIKSLSFVKDVERAIEVISKVKGYRYDPEAVHLSVNITTDEITDQWAKELHDWEVNGVLANGLKDIATAAGRSNWNFGDSEIEKEDYEAVFHLTVYFSPSRVCVGIEIYEDSEIHPFFGTTIQSMSGGLCSYIAYAISPKPHDVVLELNFVSGDIAMSTLYQFDCLYFAGMPNPPSGESPSGQSIDYEPLHMWSQLKPAVIERDGKLGQREFQMFIFSDITQYMELDVLQMANRLFCYVDFDLFESSERGVDDFYRGVIDLFGQTEMDSHFTLVIPLNHIGPFLTLVNNCQKGVMCLRYINLTTIGHWVTIVQLRRCIEEEPIHIPRDYSDDDEDDNGDANVPCFD